MSEAQKYPDDKAIVVALWHFCQIQFFYVDYTSYFVMYLYDIY